RCTSSTARHSSASRSRSTGGCWRSFACTPSRRPTASASTTPLPAPRCRPRPRACLPITTLPTTKSWPSFSAARLAGTNRSTDFMSQSQQNSVGSRPRAWAADGRVAQPAHTGWHVLARNAARWGMMTASRPIHGARMMPGFMIVGAERCGTTSMFHVLRQHPAGFNGPLPRKEVHYFDYKYHRRSLAWYQCHFPLKARARMAAPSGVAPVAFEATANYMFDPHAPQRIARDLPGVKLLVLVRDPVE